MAEKCVDEDAAKKAAKKAAKEAEKAAKEAEKLAKKNQREAEQAAALTITNKIANDFNQENYGYLPLCKSATKSGREFTKLETLDSSYAGESVWVRTRLQESRCKGSIGFLVLRDQVATIQVVLDDIGKDAIKWAAGVSLESIVDVLGMVTTPQQAITGTTQQVELRCKKIFCVSKSVGQLPFQLKDANRSEKDEEGIQVLQDTRLDNRVLDLRTLANQSIFRVQAQVCRLFREYLIERDFIEIHSPKLLGGASEGGSSVFTLSYFGNTACLAQSPQLHKQMALAGDFGRVFEVGPVFRAENSNTHRHLCEFTGLDIEMTINEHYDEILNVLDGMFQHIFEGLNKFCQKEIGLIYAQHPAEPFVWLPRAPRINFADGIQMLRDAGYGEDIPEELDEFDLSTVLEKQLGQLVKDKYKTDFYMLIRYPLKVRPFYTMPDPQDARWSNSYDFFMRGEEIVSGAQRVHDVPLLIERTAAWQIPVESISSYIESFSMGMPPHGGCGIGLERVVMLFLGLNNIRKASLFPRDPKRLAP